MKTMLATLCLMLASAGCAKPTVVIEHKIVWPWQKGVQFISLRKPVKPPVTTPEPPKAKPTAAIQWDGNRQYIIRGREKCYWSASKGAWMKPKRGACAGGICGWEAIKPGE